MNKFNTDEIITNDAHLIQSFADLNGLKQADARTVIVSADGAHVTDSEGNKLIDGIGGLWCVNVGHGRREIINAITEQLKTLEVGQYTSPLQVGSSFLILKIEEIKYENAIINEDEELNKMIQFETSKKLDLFSKIFYGKIKINSFINEL